MSKVRTSAPTASNKYFIHTSRGGLNECIRINGSSCLPNCVGYCWGAWYEMLGRRPSLSRRNAKEWFGYTADGYQRGRTPKLGAVCCWGGPGYGHVAIVIGIYNGFIVVAQSNYGGNRWEAVKCYKMNNGGYKSAGGNVFFQGFIYLPITVTGDGTSGSSKSGIITGKVDRLKYGKRYKTKVNLCMRDYPDTKSGKKVKVLTKGTKLMYYGYYAINKGVAWFWIADPTGKQGWVCGGGKAGSEKPSPYLENCVL